MWGVVAGVLTGALACSALEPRPYAIFAPMLSCEQAYQLSAQVAERLGYTVTSSSPASGSGEGVIKGARQGVLGQETVTVKLTCAAEGVHVDANADTPPCEQANRIAQRAVEGQGYTVTSFVPASAGGKGGVVKGRREGAQAQETVALTITCSADAVYIETRSDSPLLAGQDFTTAITDFRRGFFALFKPLADEGQRRKSH